MGHTNFGAVKDAPAGFDATPGINALLDGIRPSAEMADREHPNAIKDRIDTLATRDVRKNIVR